MVKNGKTFGVVALWCRSRGGGGGGEHIQEDSWDSVPGVSCKLEVKIWFLVSTVSTGEMSTPFLETIQLPVISSLLLFSFLNIICSWYGNVPH